MAAQSARWRQKTAPGAPRHPLRLPFAFVPLLLLLAFPAVGADSLVFGPIFSEFELTLIPGRRTEILGPVYYRDRQETQVTWAVPPLFSNTKDPAVESREVDFLYPVMTYDRYGEQYRWQFFQLLSFAGGPTQLEEERDRFSLYPFVFVQRSSLPQEDYTAVLPFYGRLKSRFWRDEVFTVGWPFYVKTWKKDVVTENYFLPFYHVRHGNRLEGWQFWPFYGTERKDVTARTNGFGDIEILPGHQRDFVLWPLHFKQVNGLGSTNEQRQLAFLPAYVQSRSPARDYTAVLWPFFNVIDEREKGYREWQAPWPFIGFARGEGKTLNRVWPIYSRARSDSLQSDTYLWPLYKYNRARVTPLDRKRARVLLFLYSDTVEANTETGASRRRTDLWPLFTHRRELNGNTRLQVLAPIEPILANNKSINRNYSPLWSIWRAEKNPAAGASSQSLLWNTYRHETTPERKKTSLLFGLFQYESGSAGKRVRLFYIPLKGGRTQPAADGATSGG